MAGDAHTQTEAIELIHSVIGYAEQRAGAPSQAHAALDALVARLEQLTEALEPFANAEAEFTCNCSEPSHPDCPYFYVVFNAAFEHANEVLAAADLCGDDRCKHPKGWHRFGTGACLECGCIEFAAAGSSANPEESEA